MSVKNVVDLTAIDPWFLSQLEELHQTECWLKKQTQELLSKEDFFEMKRRGFLETMKTGDLK